MTVPLPVLGRLIRPPRRSRAVACSRRIWELAPKTSLADEVEAAITRESGHAVEKRETFNAPPECGEMVLKRPQAFDPVTNPCGVLEFEAGHGVFHTPLECGQWFASSTLEKASCGPYFLLVRLAAHAPTVNGHRKLHRSGHRKLHTWRR